MVTFLIRKIVYVVLLLWIVSIISFWLSKQVPGDEVLDYISIDDKGYNSGLNPAEQRKSYMRVASLRGFDLPAFYFSITPAYTNDSINSILPLEDRMVVTSWAEEKGSGVAYEVYKKLIHDLNSACAAQSDLCSFYNQILSIPRVNDLNTYAKVVRDSLLNDTMILMSKKDALNEVVSISEILIQASGPPKIMPHFKWNGSRNQYHRWLTGLLYQKPLTSLVDGRNAWSKVYDALKWTLVLNGFAFIVSILLGVWIGIWSGRNDGARTERVINVILFALFAIPSFWLATLFIYFFSSGEWFSIFPSGGLGDYHHSQSVWSKVWVLSKHLFLPVMCLALGALAYVSRQMKQSIQHEYLQPYVSMLRAQGISEKTILRKHVKRNALFPLITLMGGSIPALLSGSLIIEVIFSIPGMGRLMYNSILARDWPVVFPVLMLVAFVTIVSYILVDIIYKWADPRVKLVKST
jgi:peptide/nickel transport system permease protein